MQYGMDINEIRYILWIGSFWLRIGTDAGPYENCFHKK
jgi:hypothetical protein